MASFKITEQSLEKLKAEGVPDEVLEELKGIIDQEVRGEEEFLGILKDRIGAERTIQYTSLILKHAAAIAVGTRDSPNSRLAKDRKERLNGAIEDAQRLVQYVARHGLEAPEYVLTSILKAADMVEGGKWDRETEIKFWQASAQLGDLVAPVSIESIEATEKRKLFPSRATRETWVFSAVTVLLLGILILVQVYWVILHNIVSAVEEQEEALSRTIDARLAIGFEGILEQLVIIENRKNEIDEEIGRAKKAGDCDEGQEGATKTRCLDNAQEALESLAARREEADSDFRKLTKVERTAEAALKKEGARWEAQVQTTRANLLILRVMLELLWIDKLGSLGGWRPWVASERQAVVGEILQPDDRLMVAWTRQILTTMSDYILPMIYGLLGASAYILRYLSRAMRTELVTRATLIQNRLRLPLGMLSGIAVGWFFKGDDMPVGFAALQPLALAFVAGYSVELLFLGIDRVIGAFAGEEREPPMGGQAGERATRLLRAREMDRRQADGTRQQEAGVTVRSAAGC